MNFGPASALLEQDPAQEIRRQRIVSWLDRDKTFASQTSSRSGNRLPQEA